MNKQGVLINGKVVGGIEWVKSFNDDGSETQGYTWNPVSGCKHACQWQMPDGSIAQCYAKAVAETVAQSAYPDGFEVIQYHEHRLEEPLRVKTPSKIFLDSMSDIMGVGVADEYIQRVLDVCREAHWHTFQLLTKNPVRLPKFKYPKNVWVGMSTPPTFMHGKQLTEDQQRRWFDAGMEAMRNVEASVRWLSAEPLSFDITRDASLPFNQPHPFDWIVIGAASNGRELFQPEPAWVENLLNWADNEQVPVFFKGNLEWEPRREDFPELPVLRYCKICEGFGSDFVADGNCEQCSGMGWEYNEYEG